MRVESLLASGHGGVPDGSSRLSAAVNRYIGHPAPLFARLPMSYRRVPLSARMALLKVIARATPVDADAFPRWPIEPTIDDEMSVLGSRLSYGGCSSALLITHDVDSAGEIPDVDLIRSLERAMGIPSAFGFVPDQSWPPEELARSLVDDGCEVYWHDVGHDGRLPYAGTEGIRASFDRVAERSPWSLELMRAFRAGQLLVSEDLLRVVDERFAIDMSIPDTERHGPFGGAAGCGTVLPFRLGGMLEFPLTMPQEVFLRHVYGLSADAALEIWLRKLSYVTSRGGVAVLNIHPVWIDRRHRDMFDAYVRFLEFAARCADLLITTPLALSTQISVVGGR